MGAQGWLSTVSSPPGAGVLVTTVVAGGISILRPFTAASRPFLRDIVFYMVAVYLTFTALYLGRVTLAWALGEQAQCWGGVVSGLMCGRHRGTGRGGQQGTELLLVPSDRNPQVGLSTKGNVVQITKGGREKPGTTGRIFTTSNFNEQCSWDADCGHQGPSSIHIPFRWFE